MIEIQLQLIWARDWCYCVKIQERLRQRKTFEISDMQLVSETVETSSLNGIPPIYSFSVLLISVLSAGKSCFLSL